MDKEVSDIRLIRLYNASNLFDPIKFKPGINLILGEKYDEETISGRKTNGVGKSLSIVFLDFCLLSDYSHSRIRKIPEEVFPLEEDVKLDLVIGSNNLTIIRNRKNAEQPIIIRNDTVIKFEKIADARSYIQDLLYSVSRASSVPSMRSLFSLLIRDEESEFKDILSCHNLAQKIPNDFSPHLFFFDISLDVYNEIKKSIKEIENIGKVILKNKKDLNFISNKNLADIKSELNYLDSEMIKMEEAIDSFKNNASFESFEKDIIEIETLLEDYRKKQKIIKHELHKIRSLPATEEINDKEIEMIYSHFKKNLGESIIKSLREVSIFKNKIDEFQRKLVNEKALELENNLKEINTAIVKLDEDYSKKIKVLNQKGILKDLKISLKIYEEKKSKLSSIKFLYDEYEKNTKNKKSLNLKRTQDIASIDELIDNKFSRIESFEKTLRATHEAIMGNQSCSFSITTNDKSTSKTPVDFTLRIFDDGSYSVNRTKVFIYDTSLLFNSYTKLRHPLFLVHDNIFNVDQDTLVQCLNYLSSQENESTSFQYILTLNRDKIETEERQASLLLDIDAHRVASFTKQNKFLKKNYQEK